MNGAAQILAGNTAGLAALVEGALVGLMVPVIDFLADYLGLGGIPAAIRDLILGLQQRIEQILDRVITFVAEQARALLGAMGIGGQEEEDGASDAKAAPGGTSELATQTFEMSGEGHTLFRIEGAMPRHLAAAPYRGPERGRPPLSRRPSRSSADALTPRAA